jgi:hypothetical protein
MKKILSAASAVLLSVGLALGLGFGATSGCGTTQSAASGATESIASTLDCSDICETAKECRNPNLDEEACVSKCENQAGGSDEFRQKLERCEDCLDGMSCAEVGEDDCQICDGVLP